ncbi:hypothetical protein Salat_2380000 [Sesamum alatum]|uniref:Uncharacterized protein n=1 Tax=Sesamum alatum TaxID=300844 RepID=A0AAE1XY18_9LAMI|nr:hypothetical protein Salat_2380000 [Sesamum alatum]
MDLPLKKRILIALKAQEQNQFICVVSGPMLPVQRRSDVCPCLNCRTAFASGQGVGGHQQHCKGPPASAEKEGGTIWYLDLNKLPQPEEEEEGFLALLWYADK